MDKPLVSIILPVYNEEQILEKNIQVLREYLKGMNNTYSWEIILINDGSTDHTGQICDELARDQENVNVIHQTDNTGVGTALRHGFYESLGEYVVTLDIDLSYSPEHIERLLEALHVNEADIAIASPYLDGGTVKNVPFLRKMVSKVVNKYMSYFSQYKFSTFTSIARAYKGDFIRSLNLKAVGYDISPEILQKASILRARIVEVPGTLAWSRERRKDQSRVSLRRIMKGIFPGLMSGFIFRPHRFFLTIGGALLIVATYIIGWIFYHTFAALQNIAAVPAYTGRFSFAVAQVFNQRPYSFIVGGVVLIVALQFLIVGFLSLQNKRYFDEQFHLLTQVSKRQFDRK